MSCPYYHNLCMRRDSPREVVERNCLGKRYAECSLFPDLDDRARL